MNFVVAGDTGHAVIGKLLLHRIVWRGLFEGSRPGVAIQAFAVLERLIEGKLRGRRCQIIHVDVFQPAHLAREVAEHRVMRMTAEAGTLFGDTVVLKMGGGKISGIVSVKAFAVGLHNVARQTELGGFRILQMDRSTENSRDDGQDKKGDEREHLAALSRRDGRPEQD